MPSIKVCKAALDEGPDKSLILRGALDPELLQYLKIAPYQREVLPVSTINSLVKAYEGNAAVPDIDLGMRGHRVREQNGCFYLQDDVYIIDGLQRVSAAGLAIQRGIVPRLGATVHFGTTEEWERERFRILNADRSRLSSNILLRNLRHDIEALDMLYRLTEDTTFILNGRVTWQQRMTRQELTTAMTFCRVIGVLHSHLGPTRQTGYHPLARGLQTVMQATGKNVMRDNVRTYFDLIDECWGVKRIAFKEGAVYMRGGFMMALAELLSGHLTFWRDNRLYIEPSLKKKIAQFPVGDPQVQNLSSSTGKSLEMLVILMINHVNSGRRTRRLVPRNSYSVDHFDDENEVDETA